MPINKSTEYGNISISLDAIASLAGGAITECYGVVGMVSKNATEGLWELMKIEKLSKGVKISIDNNTKLVTDDKKIGLKSHKIGVFCCFSYVFYVHFLAFWAKILNVERKLSNLLYRFSFGFRSRSQM